MDAQQHERQVRLARNESLFRVVNEEIERIPRSDWSEPYTELMCECARLDCIEKLRVTSPEYESIRARPTHFLVQEAHVVPDIEQIVQSNDRFVVVDKFEAAGATAESLSPR